MSSNSISEYRLENDALGTLKVDGNKYWGIHTERSLRNFQLSGASVNKRLIKALAQVKKACALANAATGFLSYELSQVIETACDEIILGKFDGEFPLDALQGGAGTSTNMNINEVIANRALELYGKNKGEYDFIHPIEHVNMHQSTNDVYPTALKIAAISGFRELSDAAAKFQSALQCKEKEFSSIVTIGRTELQDAVPITLGAQFASFADAVARDRWRTFKSEERLRVVNIGGTAVGTGLTAPRAYIFLVIEKLRQITGLGLSRSEQVMDATANADVFVEASGMLKANATNIMKIALDLRLLHYFEEISLPSVQTGSSIMPGKINPVILEAAIIASLKVQSADWIIGMSASLGTLQINEYMPLIADSILNSIDILINTNLMLAKHIEGITANEAVCSSHFNSNISIATAFLPEIGYRKAEELVYEYKTSGRSDFRAFLTERLGAELVEKTLSPQRLMALGHR